MQSESLIRFYDKNPPTPDKQAEQEEIERLTAEFLEKGGKIQECGIRPVPIQKKLKIKDVRREFSNKTYSISQAAKRKGKTKP